MANVAYARQGERPAKGRTTHAQPSGKKGVAKMTRKVNGVTQNEHEIHEIYVDKINELLADDRRIIVGLSTNQYDIEDDISSITIKLAPRYGDE